MPTKRGGVSPSTGSRPISRRAEATARDVQRVRPGSTSLFAPSTNTRVNADTVFVRLTYDRQGRLYFGMALTSGSLPAASPDGAVRLVIHVFVFCLFLAALEHTDDAGVMEQRAPPQHIPASSLNRPTVPFPPGCRVRQTGEREEGPYCIDDGI